MDLCCEWFFFVLQQIMALLPPPRSRALLLINTVGLLLVRGRVDYSSRRYADVSTEKSLG